MFSVTWDHVSPDYSMRDSIVIFAESYHCEYRVKQLPAGEWYAQGPLFGCTADYSTPEAAIRRLLEANGCRNIVIKPLDATAPQTVETLKSHSLYRVAGEVAAKAKQPRAYGCHYGFRSDLELARDSFYAGFDSVEPEPVAPAEPEPVAPAEPEPAPQYERKVKAGGIVMVSATVEVEGLGPVEFERPCLWYLGRKAWHIDFSFTSNGTRYFGTIWNRTREVELRGIYSSGTRLVAEAAKPEWRAALRKAAWPLIDAACKAYVDAIDNGDTKAAERAAMGLAPIAPATESAAPMRDDSCCTTVIVRRADGTLEDVLDVPASDDNAIAYVLHNWPNYSDFNVELCKPESRLAAPARESAAPMVTRDTAVALYRAALSSHHVAEFDSCETETQFTIACEEFGFDPDTQEAVALPQWAVTSAPLEAAMGLAPAEPAPAPVAPAEPAPVAPAEAETVQINMNWQACLPLLLAVLESGTAEGRAMARDELARMARIADTACTEESI